MLGKLFEPLVAKVLGGVAVVLLIALTIQTMRASHYQSKAENCEIGRANDRKAYELAQVQAKAAQDALNASISARYEAIAEETNAEYQKALADARNAAERYILAHRLPRPASGSSRSASSPAQGGSPGLPDDTAPGTELVAVRAEDIRDCTVDYQYARGAYDFIQGLVREKLAVPSPEFGKTPPAQ